MFISLCEEEESQSFFVGRKEFFSDTNNKRKFLDMNDFKTKASITSDFYYYVLIVTTRAEIKRGKREPSNLFTGRDNIITTRFT